MIVKTPIKKTTSTAKKTNNKTKTKTTKVANNIKKKK